MPGLGFEWQLIASLGAIAALTGAAWVLGFRQQPALEPEGANSLASAWTPGFAAVDAVLAADRRSALVRGRDGRIVLVRGMGDGWIVREVAADAVVAMEDGSLMLKLREPFLRRLSFQPEGPQPAWLAGEP